MHWKKAIAVATLGLLLACQSGAALEEEIEILALDVVSYEDFAQDDPSAISALKQALFEKGIVGIKGVPGYREKALAFIETARKFSALPEEIKEAYAPNRDLGETFLGYEMGKERFKRPDGTWVIDDLKVSYYGFIPDSPLNKWPREIDLKTPFQELGSVMASTAEAVMEKVGLLGSGTKSAIDGGTQVGRMLHYKGADTAAENPLWCGAHFDHGLFTALLPAFYFVNGEPVPESIEAGLFVKATSERVFKKVIANDPDVLLFQVGEFGQLATNDAIRATEHRVHKALGHVERYTMALFFNAPPEMEVCSTSELTKDARYGAAPGEPCSYERWHDESFKRYLVK